MLKKILLVVGFALLLAAYFFFDLGRFLTLDALKAQQAALASAYALSPVRTVAIYTGVYVLVTALSLPGAALLTLAGGALFGLGVGTLVVSFASTLGATLAFLCARHVLRDTVQARFGQRLAAIDEGVKREGAFYLFTLRLVPLFPFFLINLLLGLTAMRAWTFFWVSQLGMLAGTVVFVNAGTQLAKLDSLSGIVSPGLIGAFVLLGVFPLIARRIVAWVQARRVYAGWPKPARFDRNLVVIGAGAAGLVTSYIAAAVRAKVTLVEQHRMGGDCLNTGCVPSKALLRSAKLVHQMHNASHFGVPVSVQKPDFGTVMSRVKQVIADIAPHDSIERYTGLGVDVIEGRAQIVSPWAVAVTRPDGSTQTLTTRSIVIATGARPFVPPLPGLDAVGYVTSDTVWSLDALPQRLVVLGGGPIGCELAQAFARLGSSVTVVEMAERLLVREDADVSASITARFAGEGITVLTAHAALRCEGKSEGDGAAKVLIASHDGREIHLPFDVLLIAVGRAANLTGYGLETLGITTNRTVQTNDFLQTRFPNIYAAGDVAGPYQFTHTAAHQAWYAAVNALFDPFKKFKADYRVIPAVTYCDPEVARVGINEQEASAQGIACEVSRFDIAELDRAICEGEAHGFIKVLTATGSDRILGVTIVGEHAGEILAEYVLAMKHGLGLNKILGTIHAYPTMAEANKYAAGVWKRNHAPESLLRLVERFHDWRRGA
jgi:pyruvate/2-oxoglutarate dehydrogenase complex dihydrolipoamide dehydrogenase (E3) component/uncharacterized membrane protein YdjX (TVP38/TMEM64 family)